MKPWRIRNLRTFWHLQSWITYPEALKIVDEMLKDYPKVTYQEIGDAVGYSRHIIGDYHK